MYKYFNLNLIGNQGLVKYDQKNHCGFPTSVKTFVQNDKYLTNPPPKKKTTTKKAKNYNRHQQEKVRDKG